MWLYLLKYRNINNNLIRVIIIFPYSKASSRCKNAFRSFYGNEGIKTLRKIANKQFYAF